MNAISLYRIGHWGYKRKISILSKIIHGVIFLVYNSSIPSSAEIGEGTKFAYGCIGTVIHHNAQIGENCIIGQCVTIGSKSKGTGAPIIGSSVYIAAGARLLGNIRIGDGAVIGANAVVTHDVPARSMAYGVPARIVKEDIDVRDVSTHIKVDYN